jgi:hypothetical protein
MPRYFTIEQAELILPEVEQLLRDALIHKSEGQKAYQELQEANRHIQMAGGVRVDHGKLLAMRARRDSATASLKDTLDKITDLGAFVKDLDIGLIDFLTRYENREVYLCWKFGEKGIRFWHAIEDGFRGRKPVDEHFLAGHRGDLAP